MIHEEGNIETSIFDVSIPIILGQARQNSDACCLDSHIFGCVGDQARRNSNLACFTHHNPGFGENRNVEIAMILVSGPMQTWRYRVSQFARTCHNHAIVLDARPES